MAETRCAPSGDMPCGSRSLLTFGKGRRQDALGTHPAQVANDLSLPLLPPTARLVRRRPAPRGPSPDSHTRIPSIGGTGTAAALRVVTCSRA